MRVRAKDLTPEEVRAIAAFKRLAKRWPKTLVAVQHADSSSLAIKRPSPELDEDASEPEAIDYIEGFRVVCTT